MDEKKIIIKGAKEHNLKNVDLELPRDKFIVFTGLSGSGKSTLAFDTIFAEGQRRYLESLSSYARQFLGQMEKPDVEYIHGLSPAISIDQKASSSNPRSTVGTVTEIQDYLRLLFSKIGRPHCLSCGKEISKMTVDEMVGKILEKGKEKEKIKILAPLINQRKGEYSALLEGLFKKGFSKAVINGEQVSLADWKKVALKKYQKHTIEVLVDDLSITDENLARLFEGVETALNLSGGLVKIIFSKSHKKEEGIELVFNQKMTCVRCGISFLDLEPRLFSFNSPQGACSVCEGLGEKREIGVDLLAPDENKTIGQGGLLPFSYKPENYYGQLLRAVCAHFGIDQNVRIKDLSPEEKKILFFGPEKEYDEKVSVRYHFKTGSGYYHIQWNGLVAFVQSRYQKTQSESIRREMEKYFSHERCSVCAGSRYRPEALAVLIGKKNIAQLSDFSVEKAVEWFEGLHLSSREEKIAEKIIQEIKNRLNFLKNVGLGYLSLGRSAVTLSGGEAQRIRLASQIGSGLMGVLYILDEPSVGLHAKDNAKLLETLVALKNLGNTVIVIEHDEETIRQADWVVDIGPGAGNRGGEVVYSGKVAGLLENKKSITAQYLNGQKKIAIPIQRRISKSTRFLTLRGACEHNLKNLNVQLPLGAFVCVTGVSGSGKSTLIEDVLYKNLLLKLRQGISDRPGKIKELVGWEKIRRVIMVDQSPIGRTPRSNPATYVGAFTPIRELFAKTQGAKEKGWQPGRFSFNVPGGRCENCKGEGFLKIEMQFMADVYLPCDVCAGKRYNSQTLAVKYKGQNIAEVLAMTIDGSADFFANFPKISEKLITLKQVGLEYVHLGQSATTLSGGEAQRVKLATELSKKSQGETLYILDEPTTGLHFEDVRKLLEVLNKLVEAGNTVIAIEHNMDVIKTADWIVDLGPEGGEKGGKIIASGTPEELAKWHKESWTGRYLRDILQKK